METLYSLLGKPILLRGPRGKVLEGEIPFLTGQQRLKIVEFIDAEGVFWR
jgi:hypothetical protein